MTEEILFLPGMMLDHDMWSEQLSDFKGLGHCRVGTLSGADSILGLADQALASMAKPAHIVAFSMGAIVAMEMWRLAPQRICSFSLLGFSPHADSSERVAARLCMIERAERESAKSIVLTDMVPRLFSPHADKQETLVWTQRVASAADRLGSDVLRSQLHAQLSRPDSVPTLSTITAPTLVMIGEDDLLVGHADYELTRKLIPGAQHAVIPSAGHMLTLEQPDAVNTQLLLFFEGLIS